MEKNIMDTFDKKSLQIFEDMKSGLYERGYNENDLTLTEEDPLRYETQIDNSRIADVKNLQSTLWVCYFPNHQHVFVGVTFPDRIPEEKLPFIVAFLNVMNSCAQLQHLTLCPVCHRIDAVAGISLTNKKLPKEKFQTLLSVSEANSSFLHSIIRRIIEDENRVDRVVSAFCLDHPEFEKYYGGRP